MNEREQKPKSRRLKFGLRSALILILIVSLPLAWFAGELKQAKFEAKFLKKLESEVEGRPFYKSWFEYEAGSGFANSQAKDPKGPAWLRSIFGQNAFSRIEKLAFTGRMWKKQPSMKDPSTLELGNYRMHGLERVTSLDLASLEGLKTFCLSNFAELEDLNSFGELTGLETISVTGCDNFVSLTGIENFKNLKRVFVTEYRSKLEDVTALKGIDSFEYVNLDVCKSTFSTQENWDALGNKPKMTRLNVQTDKWPALVRRNLGDPFADDSLIRFLRAEETNRSFKKFRREDETSELASARASFRPSPNLEILSIIGIDSGLENLECCKEMPNLFVLEIEGSPTLKSLAGLENCKGLTTLRINECPNLENIDTIGKLENLEQLVITFCHQEVSFPVVSSRALERVELRGMHGFDDLEFLRHATNLKILDVRDSGLESLGGLRHFESLVQLKLEGSSLISPGCEQSKTQLVELDFKDCDWLLNLDGLENIAGLESVSFEGCYSLKDLRGLANLEKMDLLNLSGCRSLKNLDDIPELIQPEHVVVDGCLELDNVDGLLKLKDLKIFEWLDCPKLNDEKLKKIRERFPQLQETRDNYDSP